MSIIDRIKKGVKYMAMAWEEDQLSDELVRLMINEHKRSKKREWMLTGERYYCVDNDLSRASRQLKESYQADHRLIHATYKNIVDEKIGYLLSKPATIAAQTPSVTNAVLAILGDEFGYDLESLGFEASNKGVAWLRPYIDAEQRLRFFVCPAEQIIPKWTDAGHTELEYVIRYYATDVYRFGRRVRIESVEVWTPQSVRYYRLDSGQLLFVREEGHFQRDGQAAVWGRVPWIAFKNNRKELPDIKLVKALVDDYDLSRSEISNYIEEVKNLIFVLKGYSGETVDEFLREVYQKRAVALDADDGDGSTGVETLSPKMDIEAARVHYEQLKSDIIESGQAVNRNLDKFGAAPSGVALKFLFTGLDLKSAALASEFRRGFSKLMTFVYDFAELRGTPISREPVTITFNTDMVLDEAATIENCNASRGLISTATILANHPWVVDAVAEGKALTKEQQEIGTAFNSVPDANDGAEA